MLVLIAACGDDDDGIVAAPTTSSDGAVATSDSAVSGLSTMAPSLVPTTLPPPPIASDLPTPPTTPLAWTLPRRGGYFDYQLGGDYPPAAEVEVVVRDWFAGEPAVGLYNICYVNAFQTQPPDESDRPDERDGWPASVVSSFEDPDWPGEFIIDLGTVEQRAAAASFVNTMIDTCKAKGFDAVEFDNLDSYLRAGALSFDLFETLQFAATITAHAHDLKMAVAQKNTAELTRAQALDVVGFDFAVVEECAEFDECQVYKAIYGITILAIEYSVEGMTKACVDFGIGGVPVVRRDRNLVLPDDPSYEFETYCGFRGYG